MRKTIPALTTDAEAEHFVETADLSNYDLSEFKQAHFEFEPKAAQINLRLPFALLAAVKDRARARGIPYTRFVREALEQAIARDRRP